MNSNKGVALRLHIAFGEHFFKISQGSTPRQHYFIVFFSIRNYTRVTGATKGKSLNFRALPVIM
jgi:hypothetical protein